MGSASSLAARFTPLKNADHSRLRAFPCEPVLVMRGGHAPADPRRGNGPVRPSPLPTSLFVYPRDESGLARSRRAEALRRESFCQRAQSATGRSAITSDDVDLSADELGPIGFAAQAAM